MCPPMKRRLGLLFSLGCVLIAVFHIAPVFANVPSVTDVTAWTRQGDNHTILNITVIHSGYFSGHYVNWLQVNISGTIQTISMTDTSPVDQTMSSTFVVTYDMGVITDTPTVQAQANCIVHGPSAWSVVLTLPEFSSLQTAFIPSNLDSHDVASPLQKPKKTFEKLRCQPCIESNA